METSNLIIGGCGFIGSQLATELVKREEEIVLFDLIAPEYSPPLKPILNRIKYTQGDITSLNNVMEVVKKHDIKNIFNLATLPIPVSQKDPVKGFKVDVQGAINVLETARILDVEKVVYTSSVAVFGPGSELVTPIGDDAPKNPTTVYGAAKLYGECCGMQYFKMYGVDFRAVRFPWVYGPSRRSGWSSFSSLLIERAALGFPFKPWEPADTEGNWLYVKDAAKAYILARDAESPKYRRYNIAGSIHSIREVADIVKRFIPDAVIELESGRKEEVSILKEFSTVRAREELGWAASYSIEEGVMDHINEVRKQKLDYLKLHESIRVDKLAYPL